ncbi:MAG TPA: hypothetical protein VNH64_02960 [Parvularculaceae bacterium]|nr:hypothetical protein [Parvularculaceae bacterium]
MKSGEWNNLKAAGYGVLFVALLAFLTELGEVVFDRSGLVDAAAAFLAMTIVSAPFGAFAGALVSVVRNRWHRSPY